jgi:hypothetical protein
MNTRNLSIVIDKPIPLSIAFPNGHTFTHLRPGPSYVTCLMGSLVRLFLFHEYECRSNIVKYHILLEPTNQPNWQPYWSCHCVRAVSRTGSRASKTSGHGSVTVIRPPPWLSTVQVYLFWRDSLNRGSWGLIGSSGLPLWTLRVWQQWVTGHEWGHSVGNKPCRQPLFTSLVCHQNLVTCFPHVSFRIVRVLSSTTFGCRCTNQFCWVTDFSFRSHRCQL